MSASALQIWDQIQKLSQDERNELRTRFLQESREEPNTLPDDPSEWIPIATPGAFVGIDSSEEIAEQNAFGRYSAIEVPADLE